jgi:hypothetical protein
MVGSMWVGDKPDLLSLDAPNMKVETRQQAAAVEGEPSQILQPPRPV